MTKYSDERLASVQSRARARLVRRMVDFNRHHKLVVEATELSIRIGELKGE